MSGELTLSLFPGIGLLDQAFEELGFCIVRGPDRLWGGDIRRFHPPAGHFDGIIGGPPCQAFSRLGRIFPGAGAKTGNLIPEFERCVLEARPRWFLMENVQEAPTPLVPDYHSVTRDVTDHHVGGATRRLRRFTFGWRAPSELLASDARPLAAWSKGVDAAHLALHPQDPLPAVTASGATWQPIRLGGTGKTKRGVIYGDKSGRYYHEARAAQGLPDDFDLPGWTIKGKLRVIGEGVPLPMGRAVAGAVRRALDSLETPAAAGV